MLANARTRFERWAAATGPRAPLTSFRIAFAAIWLVYDLLDLYHGGTRGYLWGSWTPDVGRRIVGAQLVLVACEAGLLLGFKPRALCLIAFFARAVEAIAFPINDFFYYCAVALILAQADSENGSAPALAWPREVLVLQAAWIYSATALLKLNPIFLSGGELFVRQNYLAEGLRWPYPAFYRAWISGLPGNAALSCLGVAGEFALAAALVAWWFWPARRAWLRPAILTLSVAIHGFAAAALNVFFFGASMIAQDVLLTGARSPQDPV